MQCVGQTSQSVLTSGDTSPNILIFRHIILTM